MHSCGDPMNKKTKAAWPLSRTQLFLACTVSCTSALGQMPLNCKAPSALAAAIHSSPSAKVYDAAGAWFAQHNDMACALHAFEHAVRLQPTSAEAHFDLGVLQAAIKQPRLAEEEFRLALKYDSALAPARTSLGTLLLDEGRNPEAEAEFRKVLAANEGSATALDNLALSLSAQKRYSAAVRYWKQALTISPDSPEMVLSLGVASYKDGAVEPAIAMLKQLVVDHPDYKDAHLMLANILAQTLLYGDAAKEYAAVLRLDQKDDATVLSYTKALSNSGSYQEALASGEDYIRRVPADPEGHQVLGSIYRRLTNYVRAEEELLLAVASRPNDLQAEYELGVAYLRDQKPDKALPYLDKAFAFDPTDAPTDFALATTLRRLGNAKRATEVTELMLANKAKEREATSQTVNGNQANEFLRGGEPARAVELYRQMLAVDPKNARTEYNLALALAATHDLKAEREALERAATLDPKLAIAKSELGMMDLAAGDKVRAEDELRAALLMDPQFAPARGNLGLLLVLKGDTVGAEQMFRQAVEDDPTYAQGYLNLGLLLASRDDFSSAEQELENAASLAPKDVRVSSALGKVNMRLGKTDRAIAFFRQSATEAPQSAELHIELAIALADTYDLVGALQESEKAVRLAPQSVSAQFNRGRILFDLGRVDEARSALKATCSLAPDLPEPQYYLALLEKQQGNLLTAAELLRKVVEAQPKNVMALYFLGQSIQPTDNLAAIEAWKRAVAIDPTYTPPLWSLTRALAKTNALESREYDSQLKTLMAKAHDLDEAELKANNAIAAMQAHDWPEALKGMREAIQICGDCSAKASLHKSLGLTYCHAGDLDNGEKELRYAASLKPNDSDVERALAMIAHARSTPG